MHPPMHPPSAVHRAPASGSSDSVDSGDSGGRQSSWTLPEYRYSGSIAFLDLDLFMSTVPTSTAALCTHYVQIHESNEMYSVVGSSYSMYRVL